MFSPGGNVVTWNRKASQFSYLAFDRNVKKSACQLNTGDDWCSACRGARCTACFPGVADAPIALHRASKKVGSRLPLFPGNIITNRPVASGPSTSSLPHCCSA